MQRNEEKMKNSAEKCSEMQRNAIGDAIGDV